MLQTAPELPVFEVKEIAKIVGTLDTGTELPNVRNINKALRRAIPSVEFSVDFGPHDFKEIEEELDAGKPVIPWFLVREGERAYEHTVVVTGYDPVGQLIAVNDPQRSGPSEVEVARFMKEWEGTERTLIKLRVNMRVQRLITEWVEEKAKEVEVVQVVGA